MKERKLRNDIEKIVAKHPSIGEIEFIPNKKTIKSNSTFVKFTATTKDGKKIKYNKLMTNEEFIKMIENKILPE